MKKTNNKNVFGLLKNKYAMTGIIFFSILVILTSFLLKTKYADEKAIGEYVLNKDNGLLKEEILGDVCLKVSYKPSGLLVMQELNGKKKISRYSISKKYDPYYYFILSISKEKDELESFYIKRGQFSLKVDQMAFGMGEYLKIVTDKHEIVELKDYMYPRMYGTTGSSSFILAFENKKLKEAEWFDIEFNYPEAGIYSRKFRFKTSDIEAIPKLKID